MGCSEHLQRRLAGAAAQDLHEVGSIRESGASPDFRRGHAIEQRRLKHAHREIDASLDQHRPERFATRRQRSMQASLGYVERTRDVGRLQGCISAALPDVNSLPSLDLGPPRQDHIWTLEGPDGAQAIIHHRPRLVSDDMIALRSAAIAGVGVVHLPLLMVSDEIRNGQLVHLLPSWAPKRQVVHAVYPSKRGLLPSVRALLDYLGARFSELRED